MKFPFSARSVGLLLIASSFASPARADLSLWYNGDYDNRDSLNNGNNIPVHIGSSGYNQNSLVYDNFVVPTGVAWTVSSVFSNNQMAFGATPINATWEIRQGVGPGNGGTLVASGDTKATLTALNPNPNFYYADQEYRVSAAVASVVLTAGTYWLAVSPDSTGMYLGEQTYIETTGGANAIGTPAGNDGNSFASTNIPGASYSFADTTTILSGDGPQVDFSMGINGTSAPALVPEPSSLALIALGLAGTIGSMAWPRRRPAPAR